MSEPTPEGADTAVQSKDGKRPKKGKRMALVAALVGLGAGGAAGGMLLGPTIGTSMAASAPIPEADPGHGGEGGGAGDAPHIIDNLVVNPSDSEGSRFLLTSIALETTDADLKDELVARDVELRDALLKVLGGKTVDQLVDIGQRAALAEDLKAAIEGVVGEHTIRRLFIPQYVIQ